MGVAAGRARRRGWWGSTRRRRRTRARRCAPARTATARCTRPRPPRPTRGRGRARAAEHDPAPVGAVHGGDAQPPVEPGGRALDVRAQPGERVGRAGEAAQQQRSHQRAAGGGHAQRQRREGGARRRSRPGRHAGRRPPRRRPARGWGRPWRARARCPTDDGRRGALPATRWAATIAPAEVPTNDSHSRRSRPARVLDPRQDAHHPGFAEHAAATENQDIGPRPHALQATQAPTRTTASAANRRLYVIAYAVWRWPNRT